ncbi:TPA: phage minor tail protein L [Salmonella enterica subsp. enterica]
MDLKTYLKTSGVRQQDFAQVVGDTCTWIYRSDECGYTGPAVADEFDNPTADPAKDVCSRCARGCALRNNTGNFGGFLSINKLSQ